MNQLMITETSKKTYPHVALGFIWMIAQTSLFQETLRDNDNTWRGAESFFTTVSEATLALFFLPLSRDGRKTRLIIRHFTIYMVIYMQKKIFSCGGLPIVYDHPNVLHFVMFCWPVTLSPSGVSWSSWKTSIGFIRLTSKATFLCGLWWCPFPCISSHEELGYLWVFSQNPTMPGSVFAFYFIRCAPSLYLSLFSTMRY